MTVDCRGGEESRQEQRHQNAQGSADRGAAPAGEPQEFEANIPALRESEPFAELLADAPELVRSLTEDRYRSAEHRRAALPEVGDLPGEARPLRFDGKPQRVERGGRIAGALAGIVHAGVMGHDGKPR